MRNKKQKAEKKNMLVTVLLLIGAICETVRKSL